MTRMHVVRQLPEGARGWNGQRRVRVRRNFEEIAGLSALAFVHPRSRQLFGSVPQPPWMEQPAEDIPPQLQGCKVGLGNRYREHREEGCTTANIDSLSGNVPGRPCIPARPGEEKKDTPVTPVRNARGRFSNPSSAKFGQDPRAVKFPVASLGLRRSRDTDFDPPGIKPIWLSNLRGWRLGCRRAATLPS